MTFPFTTYMISNPVFQISFVKSSVRTNLDLISFLIENMFQAICSIPLYLKISPVTRKSFVYEYRYINFSKETKKLSQLSSSSISTWATQCAFIHYSYSLAWQHCLPYLLYLFIKGTKRCSAHIILRMKINSVKRIKNMIVPTVSINLLPLRKADRFYRKLCKCTQKILILNNIFIQLPIIQACGQITYVMKIGYRCLECLQYRWLPTSCQVRPNYCIVE